ncbi:hypothetical protein NLI96_g11281 [Meripilus lineatus]|uniref:Uncharacterized protein n=1 Tax=Meripilus lineatus TaxID=2056292 RepID=A0AAD5UTL4_9APHY|nr:hypothetical protein NLI96_g11281 [Physisporinus lineatus]
MIDWKSPEVLAHCKEASGLFITIILGVYLCYFCLTLKDVELPLLRRNLRFSMIFIPYLIGRYSAAALSIIVAVWTHHDSIPLRVTIVRPLRSSIAHGIHLIWVKVLNSFTVIFSSMNISFRPLVLWKTVKPAWYFLLLLFLVHIGLGLAAGFAPKLEHRWGQVPDRGGPSRFAPGLPQIVLAFYIYTIFYDTILLVLTILGLSRENSARNSPLWIKLRIQGVQYLVAAMVVNIPMVVLGVLHLNSIMDLFFAAPGGILRRVHNL